jgi:biopolymer transport protein ExbD
MKRFSDRHRLSTLSELNVTPLLDLAFVLLIIFMITTPLMEKSSDLVVPTTTGSGNAAPASQVEISIDRNAVIKVNNAEVSAGALDSTLAALKSTNPGVGVLVRAHGELSVQKLIDLMDAAKRAGITKFGVVSTDAQAAQAPGR